MLKKINDQLTKENTKNISFKDSDFIK